MPRQSVDKARKNITGDVQEKARLENVNVKQKKIEPDIRQNEACSAHLLPRNHVMSTKISCQVVRGISLLQYTFLILRKLW